MIRFDIEFEFSSQAKNSSATRLHRMLDANVCVCEFRYDGSM